MIMEKLIKNAGASYLKLMSSIPKKILHFVWKRHISWINKSPPGGNFASGAVLLTMAFKVSAFHFLAKILLTCRFGLQILNSNL